MRRIRVFSFGILLFEMLLSSEARAQKTNFTVGFSAFSSAFMPAFVADQSGYFSQEGVGVRLVFFQSGVNLTQSVIAESGTIKRKYAMSDLIDYRYIHEAQKK